MLDIGSTPRRGQATRHSKARALFTRDGERAAVLRALTGARGYSAGWFDTLSVAAASCGSNINYVRAALVLIRSGNAALIERVLDGDISILAAAAQAEPTVRLITAYRNASRANRVEAARELGTDTVWDEMIAPLVTSAE